ncbi:MAG: hypothetical protein WC934_11315 [Acidithiobacillus sp.]|jgi:hypothetical protein|uniref:hypothetical protein n=1 Tax=Acidithiobacillus sp. TaxID=1872118 RepID=UPI0035610D3B
MGVFEELFESFDDILEIGSISKEVEIDEKTKVIMYVLSAEEEITSHKNCANLAGEAYLNKNKVETLAFSIKEINGKSLRSKDYVGKLKNEKIDDTNVDNVSEYLHNKLVKLISGWRQPVIDTLFLYYIQLLGYAEKRTQNIKFVEPIVEEIPENSDIEKTENKEIIGTM